MSEERETCQDTIARYYAEGGEGAGQLGAPTIMRTSMAVQGQMALVYWSGLFDVQKLLILQPGMPINVSFMQPTGVRVQNIDAVLSYLKSALPPRSGSGRFLNVVPIVPSTFGTPLALGVLVTDTTFHQALKMLGIVLYPSGEVKVGYTF